MKKLVILFSFLLVALISQPMNGQGVGDAAPDFTVDIAGGGTFTLADHQGKVVMIFFFGNGCPFCKESGPLVQGIYTQYKDDPDFVAVGLDTWDSSSDNESVGAFADFVGITFPMGIDANSVKTAYSYSYDRLMVIDRNGIIRQKNNTGAINDIEGTKSAIQMYLNMSTAVNNVTEQERSISLYPLPASDRVNADIYLENSSDVQFVISDITGKTRKRTNLFLEAGAQHLEIDINDLDQGIYLYTIFIEDKVESGKLVIQ